ncbi:MAG: hypothetical protein SGI73_04435 [Chloroflexota bacterium]|nr:hypothetical protein [Chloroflexota bacterium]
MFRLQFPNTDDDYSPKRSRRPLNADWAARMPMPKTAGSAGAGWYNADQRGG